MWSSIINVWLNFLRGKEHSKLQKVTHSKKFWGPNIWNSYHAKKFLIHQAYSLLNCHSNICHIGQHKMHVFLTSLRILKLLFLGKAFKISDHSPFISQLSVTLLIPWLSTLISAILAILRCMLFSCLLHYPSIFSSNIVSRSGGAGGGWRPLHVIR